MDTGRVDERAIEPIGPREIFFSFAGRIPRRHFWIYGVGAMLGLGALVYMLLTIAGLPEDRADRLSALLLTWPTFAIAAKRLHDRGKSGWWALLSLIPVIGTLWLLFECGLRRGVPGPNRYGEPLPALA